MSGHGDLPRRANFHCALANVYDDVGEADKCLAQVERWRELVGSSADPSELADIAATLAVAHGGAGDGRASIEQGLKALRLTSGHEGYVGNGRVCVNLIFVCLLDGQYAEALRWAGDATRLIAVGVPGAVPLIDAHLALCYLNLGQRARTQQLLERIDANPAAILPARVRRHLVACRLARERGGDARPHVEAGLALLLPGSRVHLREALLIERALSLPADQALATLGDISARARGRGHGGHVLEVQMRCAQIALPIDPALARDHALQALETSRRYQPIASYRGEVWLRCGEALMAAGDAEQARRVFSEGIEWVRRIARDHVPAEFQDSFLHRNPVNHALLHRSDGA
jgi:tetratricopeptide (TPR) repeat protein